MEYIVHKTEYLDEQGLKDLWEKIKEYVAENSATVNPEDINIDLSNYVTQEQLEEALANIDTDDTDIDLSSYVTTEILAEQLLNYAQSNHTHNINEIEGYTEPDLSSYATKEEVPTLIDLSGYMTTEDVETFVTETEMKDAIANAQLEGAEVDLSSYATKVYVDDAIANIDTTVNTDNFVITDGESIIDSYILNGTRLNSTEIAISVPEEDDYSQGVYIETNFEFTTLQYTSDSYNNTFGYCYNDYKTARKVNATKAKIVPSSNVATSINDYIFKGLTYEWVNPNKSETYFPADDENVTVSSYENTKYYIIEEYNAYDSTGVYYFSNWSSSSVGTSGTINFKDYGDYAYKCNITIPTCESGYYTISGFSDGWYTTRDIYSGTTYSSMNIAKKISSSITIASGTVLTFITNTLPSNLYIVEGKTKYENIVDKTKYSAQIIVRSIADNTLYNSYSFSIPVEHTEEDYIRQKTTDLYKRYEYRDLQEDYNYKNNETYDKIPTVR